MDNLTTIHNRYKLLKFIGKGESSEVYLAKDLLLDSDIAFKFCLINEEDFNFEPFKNEFLVLKNLDHPSIGKVFDFGFSEEHHRYYITEELILGEPFSVITGYPVEKTLEIMFRVINSLCYIHSHNIIHRDIKPENLIITPEKETRMIDFGLSVNSERKGGDLGGTPFYLAPEIFSGSSFSMASDIYATGMTFITSLLGINQNNSSQKNLKREPLKKLLAEKLGPDLEELVVKMTEENPLNRYSDSRELFQDFKSLLQLRKIEINLHPFIDRSQFIDEEKILHQIKNQLKSGNFHKLCLVSGESGSGKSRLLTEILQYIQLNGYRGTYFRCYSGQKSLEPLHILLGSFKLSEYSGYSLDNLDTLSQYDIFEHLLEKLSETSEKKPVLFLDDFEKCDEESKDFFNYLIQKSEHSFEPLPLLFILSLPAKVSDPKIKGILDLAAQNENLLLFRLKNLGNSSSDDFILKLLRQFSFTTSDKKYLCDLIFSNCKGNPGHTISLLKTLLEKRVFYQTGENFKIELSLINEIIERNIFREPEKELFNSLGNEELSILQNISIFDESFSLKAVASLNLLPEERIILLLSRLEKLGLLTSGIKGKTIVYEWNRNIKNLFAQRFQNKSETEKLHLKYAKFLETDLNKTTFSLHEVGIHYYHGNSPDKAALLLFQAALQNLKTFRFREAEKEFLYIDTLSEKIGAALVKRILPLAFSNLGMLYKNFGETEKSLHFFNKAENFAVTKRQKLLQLKRTVNLLLQMGNLSEAEKFLTSAKNLLINCKDFALQLDEMDALEIKILQLKGNIEEALIKATTITRERELSYNTFKVFGELEQVRGNQTLAISCFEKSLKYFLEKNKKAELAECYDLLGRSYNKLGDYKKALEYYLKCKEIALLMRNKKILINSAINLGNLAFKMGEFDEAVLRYEEGIEQAIITGDERTLSKLYANNGNIYNRQLNFKKALYFYKKSLLIKEKLGDRIQIANQKINLAALYTFARDFESSNGFLREVSAYATSEGVKYLEAYSDFYFAENFFLQENYSEAKNYYLKALNIYEASENRAEICESILKLAEISRLENKSEENIALIEKAEIIVAELLSEDLELKLLIVKIKSLIFHLGYETPALNEIVEKALSLNSKLNLPEIEIELLLHLSNFYKWRGLTNKSINCRIKAKSILNLILKNMPDTLGGKLLMDKTFKEILNERAGLNQSEIGTTLSAPLKTSDLQFREEINILADQLDKTKKLLSINKKLNSELNLSRVLEIIMDTVVDLCNAERGFLILLEGEERNIKVARNFDQESIKKPQSKISNSITTEVLEQGILINATNAMEDNRFNEFSSVHKLKLRSVLCVPLICKNSVIGCIYVDNRFEKGAFEENIVQLIEMLADQAGIAISNAKLYEENLKKNLELSDSKIKMEELNQKLDEANKQLERKVEIQELELLRTKKELNEKVDQLKFKYNYDQIIGASPKMKEIFYLLDKVTAVNIPVLILGESGTGKELIAKIIHYNGPNSKENFVSLNCAAIPEALLESELFGHTKGSFTGAVSDKKGLFEVAHKGSIFLDEIGELPLQMQAKLLRILQEGELRRIGGKETIKVDVRVISATNRNLEEMIANKIFREDLYYRLNVINIMLPPLRERKEDIPILANHFLEKISEKNGGRKKDISTKALVALQSYNWPGNIRELENEINRAFALSENIIYPEHFSPNVNTAEKGSSVAYSDYESKKLKDIIREIEFSVIKQSLEKNYNNRVAVSKELGIGRTTLYYKMEEYGLVDKENPESAI